MCFVLLFKPSAHALSSWFWLWFESPSAFNHHLRSLQDWFSHGDGWILLTLLIYVVCGHILGVVEAEKASCGSQFAGFKEFPVEMGWGSSGCQGCFYPPAPWTFVFSHKVSIHCWIRIPCLGLIFSPRNLIRKRSKGKTDQDIRTQEMILRLKQQRLRTINASLYYSLKGWVNEDQLSRPAILH